MLIIGVIPARYASVRFPGKPLSPIAGKPMVLHVWEAARSARRLDRVVVATDDARIAACVREAGGEAVMTSPDAASGTDRVAEVARALPADAYLNLQGDEPLMPRENVDRAVETLLAGPGRSIATLAIAAGTEIADDPDCVKVAVARDGRALYFSRSPIPYFRGGAPLLPQASRHLRVSGVHARGGGGAAALARSSARSRSNNSGGSRRDIRSGSARRPGIRSAWTRRRTSPTPSGVSRKSRTARKRRR